MANQLKLFRRYKRKSSLISVFFRKSLLLILFIATSNNFLLAQSRLGSTAAEIRKEFSDPKYNLKTDYSSELGYYIQIETSVSFVVYYFDSDLICILCVIIPYNQKVLNYYVEYYNENYVIISPVKWKMYSENGIANIELIFLDEGGYCFMWY